MKKKTKSDSLPIFIKVIYFDEPTAQDYIDIVNGGRLDWSKEENKERAAKILTEIEAQAESGFNILNFIKASFSGGVSSNISGEISKMLDTTLKNTLLTDYISEAFKDNNVRKFENDGVYAPENSVSMYKMYSSYLTIVPKEQLPIDMEKLNEALLGERGYYAMLLASEKTPTCVLRFNIKAFKNNYNLADLSKMKLTYYGVKVGLCNKEQLSIEKEFELKSENAKPKPEDILDGTTPENDFLEVYDIVLAGVVCE